MMFDQVFDKIAETLQKQIIGKQNVIAFRDLINRPLPSYLWEYFNAILDPSLGDKVEIGSLLLDHSELEGSRDNIKEIKNTLILSDVELLDMIKGGLNTRYKFIISPTSAVADLVFDFNKRDLIPVKKIMRALQASEKLLENWSQSVHNAVKAINPFLATQGNQEMDKNQFTKILMSAFEKESSRKPLQGIVTSMNDIKSLIQLDPEAEGRMDTGFLETISLILKNRGYASWIPAIEVEKELWDNELSIELAADALMRLNVYLKRGLLGVNTEVTGKVEDELEDFTGFIEEGIG